MMPLVQGSSRVPGGVTRALGGEGPPRCCPPHPPACLTEHLAARTQQALHQSVFMSSSSAQPFRDLPLGRKQHLKLLPGVADVQAGKVARWTVDEVSGCPGPGFLLGAESTCAKFQIHA